MNENSIAAPYATAISSLIKNEDDAVQWDNFLNDLTKLLLMPLICNLMSAVIINKAIKIDIITKALNINNKEHLNFLKLIFNNKRVNIIGIIAKTYKNILNNNKNIQNILIQSAFALSETELANIKKVLDKKIGKNCIVNVQIKEELIGGAVIHIGDHVIDGSILGQLQQLSNKLTF
ncbi:MAG: hypothetical protein DRQ51_06040 [Gammaproteobacteria bacterium]|nr:MAG: hypothetical protein DRQ51_06040 [Gammaproteobacteria bacterium]